MHIGLNRDWLNEYYTYSLSGRDDDVHGIKISESEALEIAVLISELDFSCVAVINKSQIESRMRSEDERDFLYEYFKKKGVRGISISDNFAKIKKFSDLPNLAANISGFAVIENHLSGYFSIIEYRKNSYYGQPNIMEREILPFGEIEDAWNPVNLETDTSIVLFHDKYADNLYEFIYEKKCDGITLVEFPHVVKCV